MIPALVLAILVLKSVGVLQQGKEPLRKWLDTVGITKITIVQEASESSTQSESTDRPGEKIISAADEIEKLVERVEQKLTFRRIGPIGVVLLIWTAITLLTTIERSLNRIYGARQSRSLSRRVMIYWSSLTLGPIVLVAAGYFGEKLTATFHNLPILSGLLEVVGWTGPILVGIFLLAGLYKLLPNTKVSFQWALGGALVAVPLWLLAKWGFGLYIREVVPRGSIYGALGLLPIFLMWLNLSWTIFLFGAEISHTAANLSLMESAELATRVSLRPTDMLAGAVAVACGYQTGAGPAKFERIAARLNLPDESAQKLLDRLAANKIVCQVENEVGGAYVLARPAEKISLAEVLEFDLPAGNHKTSSKYDTEINQIIEQAKNKTSPTLANFTLADIITQEDKT